MDKITNLFAGQDAQFDRQINTSLQSKHPDEILQMCSVLGGRHIDDYLFVFRCEDENKHVDLLHRSKTFVDSLQYLEDIGPFSEEVLAKADIYCWATTDGGVDFVSYLK